MKTKRDKAKHGSGRKRTRGQTKASRRNGRKSKGAPKCEAQQQQAQWAAFKTGVYAKVMRIAPWEDPALFEDFLNGLLHCKNPQTQEQYNQVFRQAQAEFLHLRGFNQETEAMCRARTYDERFKQMNQMATYRRKQTMEIKEAMRMFTWIQEDIEVGLIQPEPETEFVMPVILNITPTATISSTDTQPDTVDDDAWSGEIGEDGLPGRPFTKADNNRVGAMENPEEYLEGKVTYYYCPNQYDDWFVRWGNPDDMPTRLTRDGDPYVKIPVARLREILQRKRQEHSPRPSGGETSSASRGTSGSDGIHPGCEAAVGDDRSRTDVGEGYKQPESNTENQVHPEESQEVIEVIQGQTDHGVAPLPDPLPKGEGNQDSGESIKSILVQREGDCLTEIWFYAPYDQTPPFLHKNGTIYQRVTQETLIAIRQAQAKGSFTPEAFGLTIPLPEFDDNGFPILLTPRPLGGEGATVGDEEAVRMRGEGYRQPESNIENQEESHNPEQEHVDQGLAPLPKNSSNKSQTISSLRGALTSIIGVYSMAGLGRRGNLQARARLRHSEIPVSSGRLPRRFWLQPS